MARLGRAQPFKPIIRRAGLTSLATVAVVSNVHTVLQADARAVRSNKERRGKITFVRSSVTAVVPDKLAPQVTVYGQVQERVTRIYVRRMPAAVVHGSPAAAVTPPATTPKPVVVTARPRRPASSLIPIWILNPAGDGTTVETPPAVRPVVLTQADTLARLHPARRTRILLDRNPAVTVPDRLPPQITVVGQAQERTRFPVHRRAAVTITRGVGTTFAPKLPAQPIVVSYAQERPRQPVHRRTAIVFRRNPAVTVPPRLPAQPLVLSQATERVRFPVHRRAGLVLLRNPDRYPPLVSLETLRIVDYTGPRYRVADLTAPRYRITDATEARYRIRAYLTQGGRQIMDTLNPYDDLECDFEVTEKADADGHWQDANGLTPTAFLAASPTGAAIGGASVALSARVSDTNRYYGRIDSAVLQSALLPTYQSERVFLIFSVSGDARRRKALQVGGVGDFDG